MLLYLLELRNTTLVIILDSYISCIMSLFILVNVLHFLNLYYFSLYLVVFKGAKLIINISWCKLALWFYLCCLVNLMSTVNKWIVTIIRLEVNGHFQGWNVLKRT